MKTHRPISRRIVLKGGAAIAGTLAFTGVSRHGLIPRAFGQLGPEKSAVFLLFLRGGYNALFGSADSFINTYFGVTASNITDLGNGLFVDKRTFGDTLPAFAKQHMASIGVYHGSTSHGTAQRLNWSIGSRSAALLLANAMGGDAAIRCAVVGTEAPPGPTTPEGGVSLQRVSDMKTTIDTLGGTDPSLPHREIAASGLIGSQAASSRQFGASPRSLKSLQEAYPTAIAALQKPVQSFNYDELAAAYGLRASNGIFPTAVDGIRAQFTAAELMIRAGANVVIAVDRGPWDSHGDNNGERVRTAMVSRFLGTSAQPGPQQGPLNIFLRRTLTEMPGYNVATVIFGDFARDIPGSDHLPNLTATVIGRYVKVGTTGRTTKDATLPAEARSLGVSGMWSYLAEGVRAPANPFGPNPHPLVLT